MLRRKRQQQKVQVPVRKNVLYLVSLGYFSILVIFLTLAFKMDRGNAIVEAFDIIEGPLLALIGGSLAISKDLIPISDDEEPRSSEAAGAVTNGRETNDGTEPETRE